MLVGATKSNTGVIETYKYDGLGQRIEKVSNTATGTQRYVFSGGHIYSEYGTDWNAAPLTHVYAGSLPLMRSKTFGTGDYFHLDRLGSVSGVTNEAGSLLGFRFYDAFGIGTTQGAIPTYGYTGSEFDGGVGLVHMGARYYDYDVGRFTQPDPLGFIDSVNRYTYALNSPLNYVDPYGTTVRTPLFGDTKKSYTSSLLDMAASFIPGYDLVKAAFNPDATAKDYAMGVVGLIPGIGVEAKAGAKALSAAEHTAQALAEASSLARSLPGEASAIAAKSSGQLGREGEAAVRSVYDIGDKAKISVNGRDRIPDGIVLGTSINEVKNVQSLSLTQQLRDYSTYAQKEGLQFNLYTRPNTNISRPLQDAIDNGFINHLHIPQ